MHQDQTTKQECGLGFRLVQGARGKLTIDSCVPGSPARLAQLPSPLTLAEIDGIPVRGISVAEAQEMLGGVPGTEHKIKLLDVYGSPVLTTLTCAPLVHSFPTVSSWQQWLGYVQIPEGETFCSYSTHFEKEGMYLLAEADLRESLVHEKSAQHQMLSIDFALRTANFGYASELIASFVKNAHTGPMFDEARNVVRTLESLEQFAQAEEILLAIIESDGNPNRLWNSELEYAAYLLRNMRSDEAGTRLNALFKRATDQGPPNLYERLAIALAYTGNYSAAIELHEDLVAGNKKDAMGGFQVSRLMQLACLYSIIGSTDRAKETADRCLDEFQSADLQTRKMIGEIENEDELHEFIGDVHFDCGDHDIAVGHYKECLELRRDAGHALPADVERIQQKLNGKYATSDTCRSWRVMPPVAIDAVPIDEYMVTLSKVFNAIESEEEIAAQQLFSAAIDRFGAKRSVPPQHVYALINIIEKLDALSPKHTQNNLHAVLDLIPEADVFSRLPVLFAVVVHLQKGGKPGTTVPYWHEIEDILSKTSVRAGEQHPSVAQLLLWHGMAYRLAGRPQTAAVILERAICPVHVVEQPGDSEESEVRVTQGEFESTESETIARTLLELAFVDLTRGRIPQAIKNARMALRRWTMPSEYYEDPGFFMSILQLLSALVAEQEELEAEKLLKFLIKSSPAIDPECAFQESSRVYLLTDLAALYLRMKDFKAAEKALKQAKLEGQNNAIKWHETAAAVSESFGDLKGAAKNLSIAAEILSKSMITGKDTRAAALLGRAIELCTRVGTPAKELSGLMRRQARAFNAGGLKDEAEALDAKANEIDPPPTTQSPAERTAAIEKQLTEPGGSSAELKFELANLYTKQGDARGASLYLEAIHRTNPSEIGRHVGELLAALRGINLAGFPKNEVRGLISNILFLNSSAVTADDAGEILDAVKLKFGRDHYVTAAASCFYLERLIKADRLTDADRQLDGLLEWLTIEMPLADTSQVMGECLSHLCATIGWSMAAKDDVRTKAALYRLLFILQDNLGSHNIHIARVAEKLGAVLAKLSEFEPAEKYLRLSLNIYHQTGESEHIIGHLRGQLVTLLERTERRSEAETLMTAKSTGTGQHKLNDAVKRLEGDVSDCNDMALLEDLVRTALEVDIPYSAVTEKIYGRLMYLAIRNDAPNTKQFVQSWLEIRKRRHRNICREVLNSSEQVLSLYQATKNDSEKEYWKRQVTELSAKVEEQLRRV